MVILNNLSSFTDFINFFHSTNEVSILFKIILAIICGGVIGAEREKSHQPAGMRTYMLVCLGATVVMITSEFMQYKFGVGDPARLGSQVISGIGFLGAGSIIVSRDTKVRGLTTAAGLWASACIGLAIGIGYYSAGIIASLAVYIIISRFKTIGSLHSANMVGVYIEFDGNVSVSDVITNIKNYGLDIYEVKVDNSEYGIKKVTLVFRMNLEYDKAKFTSKINEFQGIKYVEFLF